MRIAQLSLLLVAAATSVCSAPNTFIWSYARSGSTLLLHALASSHYWQENVHMEPFLMTSLRHLGMPASELGFSVHYENATDMLDDISTRGPFLWKEHAFALTTLGGSLDRHHFLKNPSFKHIFLFRNPEGSLRSYASTLIKTGHEWQRDNIPGCLDVWFGSFMSDPFSYASMVRKWSGVEASYLMYRYLTEVVGLSDNILVVDIEDVWAAPELSMRQIADFLGVPWSEKFLRWDHVNLKVHPQLRGWVEAIDSSGGFLPREGFEAEKDSELGALPEPLLKAMIREIDYTAPMYAWMRDNVPQRHRLRVA
eukprot:m.710505 g.710505  ORF g.710505 m.710505 type:complete len:310 (+) comp58760_c0_seq9:26-955(+)